MDAEGAAVVSVDVAAQGELEFSIMLSGVLELWL